MQLYVFPSLVKDVEPLLLARGHRLEIIEVLARLVPEEWTTLHGLDEEVPH